MFMECKYKVINEMYVMAIIVRWDREKYLIADIDKGDKVLLVDLDTNSKKVLEKPTRIDDLEDFLEKHNPAVLVCKSINRELRLAIEEIGVKVISNVGGNVNDFLKEIQ